MQVGACKKTKSFGRPLDLRGREMERDGFDNI